MKLDLENFSGSSRLNNQHDLSLSAAFALAERLGIEMPDDVSILGIETADVRTINEELSPEVEAAVSPLAVQIHRILTHNHKDETSQTSGGTGRNTVFYPPDG